MEPDSTGSFRFRDQKILEYEFGFTMTQEENTSRE
jgi:hypothetical protein